MDKRTKFVPLSSLAPDVELERASNFELADFCFSSELRGKTIDWLCLSERLLWMALGHEHIEPELLDWIDHMPSHSVVFDLGASNGIFSMYAAANGHDVTAFEPDPSNFFLLSYNNFLNTKRANFKPARCFNFAISDSKGTGDLHISKMELGGHEKILGRALAVSGREFEGEFVQTVIKISLDAFLSEYGSSAPQYIKIDVDGAEKEVLLGAASALKSVRSLFIELKEEEANSFFIPYLGDLGFRAEASWQVQRYEGLRNYIFSRS